MFDAQTALKIKFSPRPIVVDVSRVDVFGIDKLIAAVLIFNFFAVDEVIKIECVVRFNGR